MSTHCLTSPVHDKSYHVFQLAGSSNEPLWVVVNVNGADLSMEVDTGAAVSLISRRTYHSVWPAHHRPQLQPSSAQLRTYSGQLIKVLGAITVTATRPIPSQ